MAMDIRDPVTPTLRAGDRDREATASLLGQALAQGYLDMAEYERRLQAAFSTQTTPELRELTADLPLSQLRRHDPRRDAARRAAARRSVQIHLATYLAMVAIVLTVWLVVGLSAGAWYFWPIWPILGAGIGVASHALPVRYALARGLSPIAPVAVPCLPCTVRQRTSRCGERGRSWVLPNEPASPFQR